MARKMYLLAAMKLEELREQVSEGTIDTVLLAITDMQGRLMGKRLTARHFVAEVAEAANSAKFWQSACVAGLGACPLIMAR